MIDADTLRLRIEALLEHLARADRFREVEREQFVADPDTHHLAERHLHLAMEATLDIAHHIIADRGYPAPATYRDAFSILCQQGVLPAALAARLQSWAGLRDALVHGYIAFDHGLALDAIQNDLDDLCAWAATAARLLPAQRSR